MRGENVSQTFSRGEGHNKLRTSQSINFVLDERERDTGALRPIIGVGPYRWPMGSILRIKGVLSNRPKMSKTELRCLSQCYRTFLVPRVKGNCDSKITRWDMRLNIK